MTIADGPVEGPTPPGPEARFGHVNRHGRALLAIAVISGVGVLATVGFQLVVIRGLGPVEYGLFAAFLAFINVASIGSAALRNSVAVSVADALATGRAAVRTRSLDASTIEALVLGAICTVGVLLASPMLGGSRGTDPIALAFVALTATPYFLFSRAQGLLQGEGNSRSVVLWSTGAQVAQFLLSIVALALGAGAKGVLAVLLLTAVAGAVGSSVEARGSGLATGGRAFTPDTTVVIALTIAFAWLTSIDVVLVRSGVEEAVAGSYAAAAVLIKTTLIIPATLSLYLLPRFVNRRRDASMTRLGVNVTLAISFVGGLVMLAVVYWCDDIIVAVFGGDYEDAVAILPALAVAWLPWAMAQGLLIRLTAVSSRSGLAFLVVLAIVQWFGGRAVLPGVERFIVFNGVVGTVALVALFVVHLIMTRRDDDARTLPRVR